MKGERGKGIFVTGTGTDVGKTYVTALMVKMLREAGYGVGYYKAAISGAETVTESDAGTVKRIAGLDQREETMVSYLYRQAFSPHLAARLEGNPPELERIRRDYEGVLRDFEYVTVEGSGGIVCPIRWDEEKKILLSDVIKLLELPVVMVTEASLGAINGAVLTAEYLRKRGIVLKGIIFNRYQGNVLQKDNVKMVQELTGVSVIGTVGPGAEGLEGISPEQLAGLYQ